MEYDNINYKVEEKTYILEDGTFYTPDFFLYDNYNNLYKIIEIRGYRFNLEERIESLKQLKKQIPKNIETNLYTELDLRKMCNSRKLSYNKLKIYWRTNPSTVRGSSEGILNPMYGKHHTIQGKANISKVKKMKAQENPQKYFTLGKNLEAWCRERNYDFIRGERVPRYEVPCKKCGKIFYVTEAKLNKRKFCSIECASTYNIKLATQKSIENRQIRDCELKKYILKWAKKNKDIILNAKFNNIEPTLKELLNLIEKDFGIIDFRTISLSFETKSRKDFLRILKDYVQE